MRHQKTINHLGRTSAHRKAMLSNMAASLILHKRITTTLAKAKALRSYVEPLITRAKDDSTHSRRVVFSYLQNKDAVTELFKEISKKIMERPGGYTRILKTGMRAGDNADMCFIELVDYNEAMLGKKDDAKAKTTRRGRRGGKKADEAEKAEKTVPAPKDEKEVKKPKKAAKKAEEPEGPAESESGENTEVKES
ncbi:MAG: 50S ribosomal protein L17 [Bacteroidetes bacterium]|nr:50S ribosomal protein L17 [Bacteroidota bacterium]